MEQITPVWNFTTEELVDLLAKRVIHETGRLNRITVTNKNVIFYAIFCADDFIAFDKPYQMAYSGGPTDQAQFDRILQVLKILSFICSIFFILDGEETRYSQR